jgi:hypothetical protein
MKQEGPPRASTRQVNSCHKLPNCLPLTCERSNLMNTPARRQKDVLWAAACRGSSAL